MKEKLKTIKAQKKEKMKETVSILKQKPLTKPKIDPRLQTLATTNDLTEFNKQIMEERI